MFIKLLILSLWIDRVNIVGLKPEEIEVPEIFECNVSDFYKGTQLPGLRFTTNSRSKHRYHRSTSNRNKI